MSRIVLIRSRPSSVSRKLKLISTGRNDHQLDAGECSLSPCGDAGDFDFLLIFSFRFLAMLPSLSITPDGVTLLLTIVLIISLHLQSLLRIFGTDAIYAGLLFSALSAFTGWLLGGRQAAQRTALGLGIGFRSFPAALIVSVQNLTDPNVSVMVIVTTLAALVVLVPAALLMGKH